jgi:glutathione synthase
MLEAKLDRLIDSIDFVTSDLKKGKIHMTQAEALKKNGEIFSLRVKINLTLDLLATPDFYWDREKLEQIYHTTCAHLAIKKRTSVMNEKLSHIGELMELVSNYLNDKHHVRLEWYIIGLIVVEVVFEFLHFFARH